MVLCLGLGLGPVSARASVTFTNFGIKKWMMFFVSHEACEGGSEEQEQKRTREREREREEPVH